MKRKLSLLLAVIMILGSFSFAFAAEETAAETAGAFLKKVGVLEGINGDLKLEDNLRRQDAVVLVARLHGAEEEAKAYSPEGLTFTDFKDPYYRPIIKWAVDKGLVEGHTAERFGFNEDVTAQQYATILLRALGYNDKVATKEGYEKALEEAKALGILEGVEVEDATVVTRGLMAEMTFNALGVKMKDSDKTLAEFLDIKMPVEEVKELKAEVGTENLGEVVVKLSNAKLVDKAKLEDVNNYKLVDRKVKKATVDGNNVILLLDKPLVEKVEYELVIRNIDKAINKAYDFVAKDNTVPVVEKVEVLGEYGIKVITSEPIDEPQERSFLIDGRNVAMVVENFGREIILTPYHKVSFPENAKTLTVKSLKDYSGFKSEEKDFDIEIVKDDVAPEVVDVVVKGDVVEVTFDKDVYRNSVAAYWNRSNPGNISYMDGRHPIYATGARKIDTNKVEYTFERELPRDVDVTIEGVTNHSKEAMEKTTMRAVPVVDYTEPEVIRTRVYTAPAYKDVDGKEVEDEYNSKATIYLYFDKDVKGNFIKDENGDYSKSEFNPEDHFTLYRGEVSSRFVEEHGKVVSAEYDGDRRDVVVVEVEGLRINNRYKDFDYILETRNFTDASSLRNRMYRHYLDFSVSAKGTAFVIVEPVKVYEDIRRDEVVATEITLRFTERMYVDRDLAENPRNYIFTRTNGLKYDVKQLGGKVETQSNGNEVVITLPEWPAAAFKQFEVLQNITDKDGVRLSGPRVYDFASGKLLDVDVKEPETLGVKVTPMDTNTLGKDPVAAEAAVYSFDVTAGAATAGNITVGIGTSTVTVTLAEEDTPSVVALKIAEAFNADTTLSGIATAVNKGSKVTFTTVATAKQDTFEVTFADTDTTGVKVTRNLDNPGKDSDLGKAAEYGFKVSAANKAGKMKVTFTADGTVVSKVVELQAGSLTANDVAAAIKTAFGATPVTGITVGGSNDEVTFTAGAPGVYNTFNVTVEELE